MAGLEQIGLQAVLEMENFVNGQAQYLDGLGQMSSATDESANLIEKALGGIATLAIGAVAAAAVAAAAAIAGLTAALTDCVGEAIQSSEAIARLDMMLNISTTVSKGFKGELLGIAAALQAETRYSDEAVIAAEAILLKFTSISEDVFPQAIQVSADLAAVMGIDITSAAQMLGRALENPTMGMQMLRRQGIMLTVEQQKQLTSLIKLGKQEEAQAMLLDLLAKKTKGAAAAMGDTYVGKLEIFKNAISDIKEMIGGPVLEIMTTLMDKVVMPLVPGFESLGTAVTGFLDAFITNKIEPMLPALERLAGFVSKLITAISEGNFEDARMFFQGIFQTILPGSYVVVGKIWDFISNILKGDWTAVKQNVIDALGTVWATVKTKVEEAWPGIKDSIVYWATETWDKLKEDVPVKWAEITTAVSDWVDDNWPIIRNAIIRYTTEAWEWLEENVPIYWQKIGIAVQTAIDAWKLTLPDETKTEFEEKIENPITHAVLSMEIDTNRMKVAWEAFMVWWDSDLGPGGRKKEEGEGLKFDISTPLEIELWKWQTAYTQLSNIVTTILGWIPLISAKWDELKIKTQEFIDTQIVIISGGWATIKTTIGTEVDKIKTYFTIEYWKDALPGLEHLWELLTGQLVLGKVPTGAAAGGIIGAVFWFKDMLEKLDASIGTGIQKALQTMYDILLKIRDLFLSIVPPAWWTGNSPSPFENTLWGTATGLNAVAQGFKDVGTQMNLLASGVTAPVNYSLGSVPTAPAMAGVLGFGGGKILNLSMPVTIYGANDMTTLRADIEGVVAGIFGVG